eukprot:scaffold98987_cov29-Tisochrysis_lutea.AAC.3
MHCQPRHVPYEPCIKRPPPRLWCDPSRGSPTKASISNFLRYSTISERPGNSCRAQSVARVRLRLFEVPARSREPHLKELRVAPRCVDEHLWREYVCVPLEAHLIVAAPSGAVREDLHVVLPHRLDEAVTRDDTPNARGVPVASIVPRLRLEHFEATFCHLGLEVHNHGLHLGPTGSQHRS